jgi:hypothetical protein
MRDAVGQNIYVSRESQALILAHFFAVPLLACKRKSLRFSAIP